MENSRTEENNRRKGLIISVIFHTLMILLLAWAGLSWQSPPPEPGGVLVNLGIPDVGQGDENAPQSDPAPPVEEDEPEPEETAPPPAEEVEPVNEPAKPREEPKKEVKKTEDPEAIALKKKQEEERKKRLAAEKKRAEEERKRKAAEAAKKAEEERKRQEQEAKKKELEDLISGGLSGSGEGKGNTGTSGNQGDPDGDPNSNILTGISSGSGVVGGAIGNRVARKGPAIRDNSQEEGTVVIRICVDSDGNVIGNPEFTQSGSTTNSRTLINLAISNAKKWKFTKSSIDKQCGTIRYDFKLK